MTNEVEVQTFLDGYADPLLGHITFDSFDDPLLGLQKLYDQGEVTGRAVGDPRRGLETTPDIEEASCFIAYRRSNRLVGDQKISGATPIASYEQPTRVH